MFYVLIELQSEQPRDSLKDQTKLKRLDYQIIDADSLEKRKINGNEIRQLAVEGSNLQDTVLLFEKEINSVINGEEFVLCSMFSTWELRVVLPREANDEQVELPTILKYPIVLDLWKEFDRWCTNHPDALQSVKGYNRKCKNLPMVHQVLGVEQRLNESVNANGYTRKEVGITSDILLQLHKKCSSDDDTNTVLTQPYNSKLDYETFTEEQSTVLYLNNLPPDTTQGELETWFGQFGSRPVSFWTFKNIVEDTSNINNNWNLNNSYYVEEQDSVSGFATFQTFEEAFNALKLSGRSILSNVANTKQPRIVEHVVEIHPSSARILHSSEEILSAFPQSKNKPRPGDWNCPSCGFSNFQRRTACFRCSFPVPSAVQNSTGFNVESTANTNGHYNGGNNNFQQNASSFGLNSTAQKNNITRLNSGSIHQQTNNSNNNGNGNVMTTIPFRAGDWKCAACAYHNFAKNIICLRCSGPKTSHPHNLRSHSNYGQEANTNGIFLNSLNFNANSKSYDPTRNGKFSELTNHYLTNRISNGGNNSIKD
ncbi:Nrp1p KNAG_0C03780 [Huiozyma naganishii CBS 8797]|uniref:RanBP2-type domain-containing protein n=1 Tax=Huiozyma naganishii (strain ATCC MYA-139 / BCRC 22969 / CBS 8797 / KCTC 17520 / NBRC 10181 / NCYC 3082 / Yp74L-3) TaxID=1071383 RepID=J7RWV1_HUIN7|nr:hypothetical protein KNAG_0C03780 [Kazachstania naganishii CBS 8797]CCK69482.1 hypothetical protein KNAG_0C03780 [Kazachstania naganishii CBS 8797]